MTDEPELRRDPVTGRWVLIAPQRARRPVNLPGHAPTHRTNGERHPCPFCPGQEHQTPNEVYAVRAPGSAPNGPGWRLRVVPNMFPAVRAVEPTPSPDRAPPPLKGRGESSARGMDSSASSSELGVEGSFSPLPAGRGAGGVGPRDALLTSAPAVGFAEVLIECAEHYDDPTRLSDDQFAEVFRAYRARLRALGGDPRVAHASIFKNVGAEAGASLGHSHSQIIATPVIPQLLAAELDGAAAYFADHRRCVFCDLAKQERASGERVVARSDNFLIVTAFAPRFAYELWVMPLSHESRYEALTDAAAHELARLLKRVLIALDQVQNAPAYNWFLHTAPLHAGKLDHYHWHLEIVPRTARPAGLEWGFGCHITTASPEAAAAELRAALPDPTHPLG